jgi:hypothetical protein
MNLQRGRLDIAFLRREQKSDLEYQLVAKEPQLARLPQDLLPARDAQHLFDGSDPGRQTKALEGAVHILPSRLKGTSASESKVLSMGC